MNHVLIFLLLSIFFNACVCIQPLRINPSSSTIVLLKNQKEHNAVIVSSRRNSQKLDKPREFIKITNKGFSKPKIMSQRELKYQFKDLLALHNSSTSKSHRLYFKQDSMELTESSKKLINVIVRQSIDQVPSVVDIIGHTDTIGTEEQNMNKSLQEAIYVEDILKREILRILTKAKNITLRTKSYGESDLLIPTPDNTKEERNRNVEILIK